MYVNVLTLPIIVVSINYYLESRQGIHEKDVPSSEIISTTTIDGCNRLHRDSHLCNEGDGTGRIRRSGRTAGRIEH